MCSLRLKSIKNLKSFRLTNDLQLAEKLVLKVKRKALLWREISPCRPLNLTLWSKKQGINICSFPQIQVLGYPKIYSQWKRKMVSKMPKEKIINISSHCYNHSLRKLKGPARLWKRFNTVFTTEKLRNYSNDIVLFLNY